MKIALIQLNSGENKQKNIQKALSMVENAIDKEAQFILLPEIFNYRGKLTGIDLYNEIAEEIPGESLFPFIEIAKKEKVHILAGSIYEKSEEDNKVYNTSVIIDNNGSIISKYRKINLFKANIDGKSVDESITYKGGNMTATCVINNFKIGLSICFDLRFPELFRKYYNDNVDLIVVPSSFTRKTGKLHWEVLLRARAIENYCYVLAPNQCGKDGNGIETYGHTLAVGPQGNIIGIMGNEDEGILVIDTDLHGIPKAHNLIV